MIQINMDMPKDCMHCIFRDLEGLDCLLNPESNNYPTHSEQHEHCPLIEVKDGKQK